MIISQANQSFIFGGISITDWIQPIGSLIAIIAVIVGFVQFYKDSKEKQNQINVLTELANESKEHTNQLIKANEIQQMRINQFEEKRDSEKKQRILEIKPLFTLGSKFREINFLSFPVKNIGETATLIDFMELDGNSIKSNILQYVNKRFAKNDEFNLCFPIYPPNKLKSECLINLKIIFIDIEFNKYFFVIEGGFNGSIKITKQEAFIESI